MLQLRALNDLAPTTLVTCDSIFLGRRILRAIQRALPSPRLYTTSYLSLCAIPDILSHNPLLSQVFSSIS